MSTSADVQASFAATLVDEWVRNGVTDAVVAPGSRSTPLIVALGAEGRLRVHVVLDERSAGFLALGLGLARGVPAVVVTTSGTAAAELHPAVIEAHQAGVPLLAVTADRPAELHRVGAPQTIEQEALFAGAVRWSAAPGVADAGAAGTWRSLASRAVAETIANPDGPGPVHLNLAFREPLLGQPTALPSGRPAGRPWHEVAVAPAAPPEDLVARLAARAGRRGLIVAGGGTGVGAPVHAMAAALGWPVLADPLSGARVASPWTVAAADTLLRVPEVARWRPEVVLRLGQPWASRVLSTWLGGLGSDTEQVLVDPYGRWSDPERQAGRVLRCDVAALSSALGSGPVAAMTEWAARWIRAESAAQAAVDQVLALHPSVTEPALARTLAAVAPAGSTVFVSSSMPVRDVEWYARPRAGLRVLSNRGANGIDGIISTAIGVACGSGRVTALLGDLAFLYDAGALLWAVERGVDCTLVVVDNQGGGIFSFLPQAQGVAPDQFERFWGTPHRLDLARVAEAYGVPVTEITSVADLAAALEGTGMRVVLARTDRQANVAVHREIEAAVTAAVTAAVGG
ncbi:MAG: 2-succinyl-5-enolpyruvyl-6-hydroxy-3-cyclohexene-carboxylate synthase [Acidimicrobiaceae bacterium]|nr:2-succinyl-5-enolpyruvyl-6-hydroxy-3-cyclohexene-carboxylate synthase [Acidimicrobiaceae bacterium]